MLTLKKFPFVIFLIIWSCGKEEEANKIQGIPLCNKLLNSCGISENRAYCTFGFKFGNGSPFSPSGYEKPGPGIPATPITYKFQDEGYVFDTHSQSGVVSRAFNETMKADIRELILKWSSVANIEFVEKSSTEETDIRIISATITQGGIGYPAYAEPPCNNMAGNLVLSTRTSHPEKLVLHEMGHVLGLGHVSSDNVMNPQKSFEELQPGDILGIQSIYGVK